jgi:hypothetical protein
MYRKVSHGRTMPARRSSKVSRVARGRLSALAILAAEIIEHYSNFVVLLSPLPHKCRHMSFLVVLLSSCIFCGSHVATLFLATRLPQKMLFWRHVCGSRYKRTFEAPVKTRAIKKLLSLLSLIKFKLPHICRHR